MLESHLKILRSDNLYYQRESLIHKPQNLFQILVFISFTQKYGWVDFEKHAFSHAHIHTKHIAIVGFTAVIRLAT